MELAHQALLSFLLNVLKSCKEPHKGLGVKVKWRLKENGTKSLIAKALHSSGREGSIKKEKSNNALISDIAKRCKNEARRTQDTGHAVLPWRPSRRRKSRTVLSLTFRP